MLKIVKVSGRSLYPEYQHGDFLIVSKFPMLFSIKKDDMIVFQDPIYGRMVKKVSDVDRKNRKYFVLGFDPDSLDSRQLGWITRNQVKGKVLFHIRRKQ